MSLVRSSCGNHQHRGAIANTGGNDQRRDVLDNTMVQVATTVVQALTPECHRQHKNAIVNTLVQ